MTEKEIGLVVPESAATAGESRDSMSSEDLLLLMNGMEKETAPQPDRGPSDLEHALGGGLKEVMIPVVARFNFDEREFHVPMLAAWGWTPFGAFFIGHWEGEDEDIERPILVHGDAILSIELQREPYNAAIEAQETTYEEELEGTIELTGSIE